MESRIKLLLLVLGLILFDISQRPAKAYCEEWTDICDNPEGVVGLPFEASRQGLQKDLDYQYQNAISNGDHIITKVTLDQYGLCFLNKGSSTKEYLANGRYDHFVCFDGTYEQMTDDWIKVCELIGVTYNIEKTKFLYTGVKNSCNTMRK